MSLRGRRCEIICLFVSGYFPAMSEGHCGEIIAFFQEFASV
jgi:hypothetical protein